MLCVTMGVPMEYSVRRMARAQLKHNRLVVSIFAAKQKDPPFTSPGQKGRAVPSPIGIPERNQPVLNVLYFTTGMGQAILYVKALAVC